LTGPRADRAEHTDRDDGTIGRRISGFPATIEWLLEWFQREHGLQTRFPADRSERPLNEERRTTLFQAVRELLVNVTKHAHARRVDVTLEETGGYLQVRVADDGRGFPAALLSGKPLRHGQFGLFSIRERLGHLGGSLAIESQPSRGATVLLKVPLPDDRPPASGDQR